MKDFEISVVTSREGFHQLRSAWDQCLHSSSWASIFVTCEWLYSWWIHYGIEQELRLYVARRSGRVVGLLPLYTRRERVFSRIRARVLRFVGTGADTSPDHLGPVVEAQDQKATLAALCRATLADKSWDALQLCDVRADSEFVDAMESAGREMGCLVRRYALDDIAVIPLPPTWDEYLQGLRRNQRHNARRARTRLENEHRARFFRWEDGATLDHAIDRLGELHRLRWNGRSKRCGFSSDRYVSFHREVMHACHSRGWLRLNCLALNGDLAGVNYAYAYRDEVSLFQTAFDPDLHQLRPGYALLGWSIEHAIREGAKVFDFLKGRHSYKEIWARATRPMCLLRANRQTPAGLLTALWREQLPRPGRQLKRIAPANNR